MLLIGTRIDDLEVL